MKLHQNTVYIMLNQHIHKIFINTYLFLINLTFFDTQASSSGSCSFGKLTNSTSEDNEQLEESEATVTEIECCHLVQPDM